MRGIRKELNGATVLLAEDDTFVASELAARLNEAGAKVAGPVATVSQALDTLESADIDVAVIDFMLEDSNSASLQEALDSKHVPFVVITGYPRALVRRDPRQTVLGKPVSPEELCSAVRAALAS
jgi:DNA-binding NarL/FixJ family response regulator